MIKRYCDICEVFLDEKNHLYDDNTFKSKMGGTNNNEIEVNVQIALNGTWNKGDFCKYCVIDTIKIQDDRPKSA